MGVPRVNQGFTVVVPRYNRGEPFLDHGMTTLVEPCYHGRLCRGTPIPTALDESPEVGEWLSKRRSRINNYLFTYTPYESKSRNYGGKDLEHGC